jgi:hypothetical protein
MASEVLMALTPKQSRTCAITEKKRGHVELRLEVWTLPAPDPVIRGEARGLFQYFPQDSRGGYIP